MKKLRWIFTFAMLATAGFVAISTQRSHAQGYFAFYASVINASNGEFQYTGALAADTEKNLKSAAAAASTNGTAILIGNGSGAIDEPITDIQIVGIGGKAYGEIQFCPPEE
ncbi:MAG TPA: hypothetical protein VGO50_01810 [Pyrinomonadaceae bacterium]|jgi:hypothetical protein|nr:hypothetical protein [Pyrinomonadaceae bacterium]